MPWTIRTRMLVTANLLVLAVGIAVGWVGIQVTGRLVETRYADDAVKHAASLVAPMRVPLTDTLAQRLKTILGGDVCVLDEAESPPRLAASSLGESARREFLLQIHRGGGVPTEITVEGQAFRVSSAFTASQPEYAGDFRVCLLTSKRWLAQEKWRAAQRIIIVTVAALVLATLLGLWLAHSLTRPVRSLAEQVSVLSQTIEGGHDAKNRLLVTMPAGAPVEIAQFADAFGELLRRLEHSREQLARTAQLAALGRLAASVVHELRNPLSGIRMNAQLLADAVPPETAKSLELIIREVDRMDLYLQELLGLASGAGVPGLRENAAAGPVRLEEVAQSVLVLMEARLRHARVETVAEFAPDLPAVRADANKLRQVILNLVLNAMEAMSDGGKIRLSAVSVNTQPETRNSQPGFLHFSVADSGPGVTLPSPDTDIFEPFVSMRPKGTGLGLYICRQIIESQGGRIGYDSTLQGAVFWFELPV